MAAPVASLLRNLGSARALIDSLFTAEKAKILSIKSQANDTFQTALQELQNFRYNVNSLENKTSEHSELMISAAETAFVTENHSVARELVEEFLLQNPQQDQFYCRAKIVLGLLIDHEARSTYGEVNIQQRKLALKELQTALRVALSPENKERYQFILFNLSIECWKIVRQFLRKGRAKYFKEEMVQICQSLETLKTVDKSWLISFLSGTAYCLEDGDEPKKAIELLDKALVLAEELVADVSQKETQKLDQIIALSKQIDELQRLIHQEQESEEKKAEESPLEGEAGETQGLAGLMHQVQALQKQLTETKDDSKALSEAKLPLQDRVMRLHFQKIYAFPADGKKLLSTPQVPSSCLSSADLPQVSQSLRMKCLTTIHLMCAGCLLPTEHEAAFKNLMAELDAAVAAPVTTSSPAPSAKYSLLAETYFDLCRTARHLGGRRDGGYLREVSSSAASKGKDLIRVQNILTPLLLVKQDLCSAVLAADNCQNYSHLLASGDPSDTARSSFSADLMSLPPLLTESQIEGYTLNSRLETIKLLERVLSVSQSRIKDDFLTQEICVEIWNVMYPLVQQPLRKQIHRSLQLLSAALLEIDSPLYRLRCQVAYELSKCEENMDFVVKAHQEGLNALELDYGELNNLSQDFLKSFGATATASAPSGKAASPRGNKSAPAPVAQAAPSMVSPSQPVVSRKEHPGYDSDRRYDVLISPYVDILHLRASVYDSPDMPEDQILLNLQQIRESSSKRYKKDLLSKSSQSMFEILRTGERENDVYWDLNEIEQEHYAHLQQELLAKQEMELRANVGNRITTVKASSVGSMVLPLRMIEIVLEKFLRTSRSAEELKTDLKGNPIPPAATSEAPNSDKHFTTLSKVLQKRVSIMSTIADFGHVSQNEIYKQAGLHHGYVSRKDTEYRVELSYIVEKSLLYLLTHSWKPKDFMFRKLVVGQVDALCKLAESLINRLDGYHVSDEDLMIIVPHTGSPLPVKPVITFQELENPSADADLPHGTVFIDPRSMGILGKLPDSHKTAQPSEAETKSDDSMNASTDAMLSIKRTVLRLLTQALSLAMDSLDITSIHNVLIYFWNIHLHVFKYSLYHLVLAEFFDFLDLSLKAFDVMIQSAQAHRSACGKSGLDKVNHLSVDYKLQANVIEVFMLCQVARGNLQAALDVGLKGCNGYKEASTYSRRRLCELVSRLTVVSGSAPGPATQAAKGAKKPATNSSSSDIPLPAFDHPILIVISQLVALEVTTSSSYLSTVEDPSRFQSLHPALIEKATALMRSEVVAAVSALSNRTNEIGERIPLSQEENDETQELLVSCWARLTRANLKQENIYATNDTANECMLILNSGISQSSRDPNESHDFSGERKLKIHKRVWRWASLCSRYMGLAISHLIHGEGQEKELQNELRLASLRHFAVSAQFGENAEHNDLILFPAIDAWNVFLPLIDEISQSSNHSSALTLKKLSNSLINLQRSIIKCLLRYQINPQLESPDEDSAPSESDPDELIHIVKLNYYLAVIEELTYQQDWRTALDIVMESFDNVPSRYQKPLWKWRVIVMSKRGKNVLDGLQKLKETDVILQARVFAILARNSSKPAQQLEAYQKTVEILSGDLNRVEYMLEIAQWISSSGLPTSVSYEMIQGALDSLYEIEEICLADEVEPLHDGTVSESSRSQKTNKQSRSQPTRTMSRKGSAMMLRSRQGSKQSLRSEKLSSLVETPKLNLKQLDQAVRGVSMLCLLESVTEAKCSRALEVIFFIERSLLCWQGAIEQLFPSDGASVVSKLPTDPIDLLVWTPPNDFVLLAKKCQEIAPLFVPSPQSLTSIQLTYHYLLLCYEVLEQNGYVKSAALCLAWLRLCVLFGSNLPQVDVLLVILYFKSLSHLSKAQLLKRVALSDESRGVVLPEQLGLSSTTVAEVVRKIGFVDPAVHHPSFGESALASSPESPERDEVSVAGQSLSTRNSQRSKRSTSRRPSSSPLLTTPLSAVLTYTKEYSMSIETLSYYLIVSELLLAIGQVYRAKKIATYVYHSCQTSANHRLKVVATRILSELCYLSGGYTEAIYLAETCKVDMSEASDLNQLAKQIQLLMSCYLAMKNPASAATLMTNSIQLFSAVAAKQSQAGASSNKSVGGASSTRTFPTEATFDSRKTSAVPINDVLSYNTLEGFVSIATEFMSQGIVSTLISTLKSQSRALRNPFSSSRSQESGDSLTACRFDSQFVDFTALSDLFQRVSSLLKTTHNQRSRLYPSLLSSYARCVFRVVRKYYCDFTRLVAAGEQDLFGAWVESNLSQIAELYEEAVGIVNGLQNRVPLGEMIYLLKKTAAPQSPRSTSQPNHERLILSSSLNYEFLRLQAEAWEVLLFHHLFTLQNKESSLQVLPTDQMNPVERYLDEHRPSTAAKSQLQNLASLGPALIDKCVAIGASLTQLTTESPHEVLENYVLFYAAKLGQKIAAGELVSTLSVQWQRKIASTQDSPISISDQALIRQDDLQAIQLLESYLLQLLFSQSQNSLFSFLSLSHGSFYLLESAGRSSPSVTSFYLLTHQNIATREWLYQLWKECLNPAGEIYQSLRRVELLSSQHSPVTGRTQERLQLEYEFLKASSSVWDK
jgi:hypothetical protein